MSCQHSGNFLLLDKREILSAWHTDQCRADIPVNIRVMHINKTFV